jgi:phosphohistidine phosphatase
MGVGLAGLEPPPQCVITSPARRAISTANRVCRGWGYDGTIVSDERLWQQGSTECLQLLRALDDTCQSVLLVGHNPSMEELAFLLGDRTLTLATSTVVRIDLPVDRWNDLRLPADGSVQHVWMADRDS